MTAIPATSAPPTTNAITSGGTSRSIDMPESPSASFMWIARSGHRSRPDGGLRGTSTLPGDRSEWSSPRREISIRLTYRRRRRHPFVGPIVLSRLPATGTRCRRPRAFAMSCERCRRVTAGVMQRHRESRTGGRVSCAEGNVDQAVGGVHCFPGCIASQNASAATEAMYANSRMIDGSGGLHTESHRNRLPPSNPTVYRLR